MDNVVFARSRLKTAGFFLGAMFFVGAGYLMTYLAERLFHRMAGWAAIAFFGAVAISAGWALIRGGEVFTFDRTGIADHHRGMLIPWTEIDEAVVVTVNGAQFLGLVFHHPEQFLSRVSPLRRVFAQLNERMGWCYWNFTFSGVTPGIDEALRYIRDNVPGVRCRGSRRST
jgi:hypothetical protein